MAVPDLCLYDLVKLQGEIKLMLMNYGLSESSGHEIASEIFHILVTSRLVRDKVLEIYSNEVI